MIVKLKNALGFLAVLAAFSLAAGTARAHVLQGPHILDLAVKAIVKPVGLVVQQQTRVAGEPGGEDAGNLTEETLWFSFPGKLRAETVEGTPRTIRVWSGNRFAGVEDGVLVSSTPSRADLYTAPLLFRNRESLRHHLEANGVDVTLSSIQRYGDAVCYVVGDVKNGRASTFWVDKETFFPVKYISFDNGRRVEIRYQNWSKVSRTWYPMEISILVDDLPVSVVNVISFELESGFSASLFDVDHLLNTYPESPGDESSQEPGRADDLESLDPESNLLRQE
ncbi:MAG: outer membrane lipoprotein-sorting protein [Desulfobacteraceae bacterium]|nr:outer membrane lipoprotein-sorting protein [Desulfobacteraceae bacterium]